MPYLTCSACGLSLHSASAYLPYSDCPRCARRGRTVPLDFSPFRLKRSALAGRAAEKARKMSPINGTGNAGGAMPQVLGDAAHADGGGELGAT